jgi:hypothetical protein
MIALVISRREEHGKLFSDPLSLLFAGCVIYLGLMAIMNFYRTRQNRETGVPVPFARFSQLIPLVFGLSVFGIAGFILAGQVQRELSNQSSPTAPDYAMARVRYETAAAAGDGKAMNDLGWLYQNGLGVTQDYAKARGWFEEAAAAGSGAGMSNLGSLYQNGWGVPQDYSEAREWFEKGAVAGHDAAMSNLGWLHERYKGRSQRLNGGSRSRVRCSPPGRASASSPR